jgi:hypothetical protein
MDVRIVVDSSFKLISENVRYERALRVPYSTKCCGFLIEGSLISPEDIFKILTQLTTGNEPRKLDDELTDKVSAVMKLSNKFMAYIPKAINEIAESVNADIFTHCDKCDGMPFPYVLTMNKSIYDCVCRDIRIEIPCVSSNPSDPIVFTIGNCKPVTINVKSEKILNYLVEIYMSLYCKLHTFIDDERGN